MNLLPNTEKEALRKGLKLRSLILVAWLVSAFFFIGFVMLLPSYFIALGNLSKIAPESQISGVGDDGSVQKILDLPAELDSKLKFLQSNNNGLPMIDILSKIIKYLPDRVNLDSILFTKDKNYKEKRGVVILMSGIASDRDSLVSFSNLLKESDLFTDVEVPVSSLTKDKNLPFSMNIFIEN